LISYTIGLVQWLSNGEYTILDQTSVDADHKEEAIEHATDLFITEFGWAIADDMGFLVLNEKELTKEEIKEIEP
jgi:hypothetical protein